MPTPAPLLLAVSFFPATAPIALADAALKSAALLLLAALVAPFLKKFSAAARHALWSGALAAALLLPLLSLALPAWRVPWLPDWQSDLARVSASDRSPLREQRDVAPPSVLASPELAERASLDPVESAVPATSLRDEGVAAPSDPLPPSIPHSTIPAPQSEISVLRSPSSVLLLYFCGATLALLPLLAGWLHAARLTRRARPLDSSEWTALLTDTARALQLRARVRLFACTESGRSAAPGAAMPFTWGALRPAVVFPADAVHWPAARRRLVLLHELGHIRRHDWLAQTLAALACALHWFNPLAWLAARRMRLEREQACDDLVLGSGQTPQDYARELLALATASARGGFLHWTTVPMARPTTLEARLRAILDRRRNRAALTPAATLALAALLAAVAIPLAMLRGAGNASVAATSPATISSEEARQNALNGLRAALGQFQNFSANDTSTATRPPPNTPTNDKPRISVDFSDASKDIRTVLHTVADLCDLNVVVPVPINGQPRLKMSNATWQEVFHTVLAATGYTFVEDNGLVWIIGQADAGDFRPFPEDHSVAGEQLVSVDYPDPSSDIRYILLHTAKLASLDVVIPATIQGKASFRLHNVSWRQVFRAALAKTAYAFERDRNLVRIVKIEPNATGFPRALAASPNPFARTVIQSQRATLATTIKGRVVTYEGSVRYITDKLTVTADRLEFDLDASSDNQTGTFSGSVIVTQPTSGSFSGNVAVTRLANGGSVTTGGRAVLDASKRVITFTDGSFGNSVRGQTPAQPVPAAETELVTEVFLVGRRALQSILPATTRQFVPTTLQAQTATAMLSSPESDPETQAVRNYFQNYIYRGGLFAEVPDSKISYNRTGVLIVTQTPKALETIRNYLSSLNDYDDNWGVAAPEFSNAGQLSLGALASTLAASPTSQITGDRLTVRQTGAGSLPTYTGPVRLESDKVTITADRAEHSADTPSGRILILTGNVTMTDKTTGVVTAADRIVFDQGNEQIKVENGRVTVPSLPPKPPALVTEALPINRPTVIRMLATVSTVSMSADPFAPGWAEHNHDQALTTAFQTAGVDFAGTPGAKLAYHAAALIVTQTPDNLAKIRDIINRQEVKQVSIEAKFLERIEGGLLPELETAGPSP